MSSDDVTRFTIFSISFNLVLLFIAIILHVTMRIKEGQREILQEFAKLHIPHLETEEKQALYIEGLAAVVTSDAELATKVTGLITAKKSAQNQKLPSE